MGAGTDDRKGLHDLAIADCDKAISLIGKEDTSLAGIAYASRGNAYRHKGLPNQAIADYTEALKCEPTANRYYFRGAAYAQKGDSKRAKADKERGLKLGYGKK